MHFLKRIPALATRISSSLSIVLLVITVAYFSCTRYSVKNNHIDLSGSWQFRIDSLDMGIIEEWYLQDFQEEIALPGSMKDAGYGNEPSLKTNWTGSIYDSSWYYNPDLIEYRTGDTLKFPFWLSPVKHYVGPAWYRKYIAVPDHWNGERIILRMERPHWESTIWVDDQLVSSQNSLSVPHEYDLTRLLIPGKHTLTVRIDNRLDKVNVGPDSHSVSDHTQGNWNGVIGEISLSAEPQRRIADIQLFPDLSKKQVRAVLILENPEEKDADADLILSVKSIPPAKKHVLQKQAYSIQLNKKTDTLEYYFPMGTNFNTWDEFTPDLYHFKAELKTSRNTDISETTFGMREIITNDKTILINGRPTFFRGNVDCCVFPQSGYPAMDVKAWKEIYNRLKEFGLNHVRFHSWCPPEAAFIAADETGMYLQPEGPSWPNHGTSLGNGRAIDKYIYEESERIIKEYGNHPSFVMFASGNEPRGNYVAFLDEFLSYWKEKDDRRIYTGASIGGSWRACPENQYHVKGGARGLPWKRQPGSDFDYSKNIERFEEPFITHELGQYCVFPDLSEIAEYKGTYKAYNFELFRDLLDQNHMGDQAEDFLLASGELQKRCYKYEIEASTRTNGMVGYQLLGLNDFPGQGTALVGVLNAFYEPKAYVDAGYFKQFCAPVTLLAALPKFVWRNNEEFTAKIELANYGNEKIRDEIIIWKITDENKQIIAKGKTSTVHAELGEVVPVVDINFKLHTITKASKLTLTAYTANTLNHWDFWVYPAELPEKSNSIHITDTLNNIAVDILKDGGKVLLLAAGRVENGKDVVQYFTPVFWNTSWFKMRPPHTTGLLIRNNHPVFNEFPTSFHSDLQWWELTNRQQVMNLENFPASFRPLVQPIDTWFISRRLGLLWEANVGKGKIIVCSTDLSSEPEKRPAAMQLQYSIIQYMESPDFNPEFDVPLETIQELFEKKDRNIIHMYTKDSPDELKPKH